MSRSGDGNTPFTPAELAQIRKELNAMHTDQLWHLYAAAHSACNPGARRLPKTRAIQQLVQAWRELQKRLWT
jgi:hypothetical protein